MTDRLESPCDVPAHRQVPVRATYMRGGTSKGVFFSIEDLPPAARVAGAARDALCLRVVGSPDPYGKQIDGMGAASSSTSKVVLVSKSLRPNCDVDYLFGQVGIQEPVVDWSGSCGNLVAAVGPFAIERGLVTVSEGETAKVRIWQANLGERITVHVPLSCGQVQEEGQFELDGVAFPAPGISVEFLDPGGGEDAGMLLPTGHPIEMLEIDGRRYEVTLITAGNPTIFVNASALDLIGTELPANVDANNELLARFETLRASAAVRMGLASSVEEATRTRPHTPKLCFVSSSADYLASNGKLVSRHGIDLVARIVSMGKLHHALTGTGAVALASAAAIPDTVVQRVLGPNANATRLVIGHVSGTLVIGAWASAVEGQWRVSRVVVQRSARRLMDGTVFVPAAIFATAG